MKHLHVGRMQELLRSKARDRCLQCWGASEAKSLHAHIIKTGLKQQTFFCNRLIQLYADCGLVNDACAAFWDIVLPNIYSWNTLLAAFAKHGSIKDALSLFSKMPRRNHVSWNTVIAAFPQNSANFFLQMQRSDLRPNSATLATVITTCRGFRSSEQFHSVAIKLGLESRLPVANSLIDVYGKEGKPQSAGQVFDEMSAKDAISWTALILGFLSSDEIIKGLEYFVRMVRAGTPPDHVTFSGILGACARIGTELGNDCSGELAVGRHLHAHLVKSGFESNIFVGNSLVDMYSKCYSIADAESVFGRMLQKNVVSWNAMIAGYGLNGLGHRALDMFLQMRDQNCSPDSVTFLCVLKACVREGFVEDARRIFDEMSERTLQACNAMLSCYLQSCRFQECLQVFRTMSFSKDCFPDQVTISTVLSACSSLIDLDTGKQIHCLVKRSGLESDVVVASALLNLYAVCGKMHRANRLFEKMPTKDSVAWNTMIAGSLQNGLCKRALKLFDGMVCSSLQPDASTFSCIISACAKLSIPIPGKQLHSQALKRGFSSDICVSSSLIDMYAKSGSIAEARLIFDELSDKKTTVPWNSMITGYAVNGFGGEALNLFTEMLELDLNPDEITFVALLFACSHAGLVDLGLLHFGSMSSKYSVIPQMEHYACVVDLLCRAGRLDDALEFIRRMPVKDKGVLWRRLLSACTSHCNAELDKFTAESLP